MRELALHLLDIAENSVAASAKNVTLTVVEDLVNDRLQLSVEDDGRGMDAEMVARVVDPFVTSRTTRKVGLGIPLLKAAAEACNGFLTIDSALGRGTKSESVMADWPLATANAPTSLGAALSKRPGRFDRAALFAAPTPELRQDYLGRLSAGRLDAPAAATAAATDSYRSSCR